MIGSSDRYLAEPMARIWSDQGYLTRLIQVELAALEVLHPSKNRDLCPSAPGLCGCRLPHINLDLWRAQERRSGHEIVALLELMDHALGHSYAHVGMTSSDATDTARAMQMQDSAVLLANIEKDIMVTLVGLVKEFSKTPTIGRTHGQWAVPMPLSHRFSTWYWMFGNISVHNYPAGKISGAVGTNVFISHQQEAIILSKSVVTQSTSTQIVPRTYWMSHWQFPLRLAVATEKILNDLCRLSSSEIREFIPPGPGTSSTMVHKRNPAKLESATGPLKLVRQAHASLIESAATNNLERDLTNSSVERVCLPILYGYTHSSMLVLLKALQEGTWDQDRMRINLQEAIEDGCLDEYAYIKAILDGKPRHEARKSKINQEEMIEAKQRYLGDGA